MRPAGTNVTLYTSTAAAEKIALSSWEAPQVFAAPFDADAKGLAQQGVRDQCRGRSHQILIGANFIVQGIDSHDALRYTADCNALRYKR